MSEDEEKMCEETSSEKKEEVSPKPGVIYLSRIPAKMNVKLIREYMSKFGKVGRIYLEPREKRRKNEPRSFKEGWVEFEKRKVARQVADMLNNTTVGGKRRNPWYHELWNIKYLKNFRWTHLNERVAYEQELKKQKLRQDIALAKKEANFYIQNFEKNERRKRVEKKETGNENVDDKEWQNTQANERCDNNQPTTSMALATKTSKHPVFERKTKVTDNEDFLKQIFS